MPESRPELSIGDWNENSLTLPRAWLRDQPFAYVKSNHCAHAIACIAASWRAAEGP